MCIRDSQITSDSINFKIYDNTIEEMNLIKNAFIVSRDSMKNFNQINLRLFDYELNMPENISNHLKQFRADMEKFLSEVGDLTSTQMREKSLDRILSKTSIPSSRS